MLHLVRIGLVRLVATQISQTAWFATCATAGLPGLTHRWLRSEASWEARCHSREVVEAPPFGGCPGGFGACPAAASVVGAPPVMMMAAAMQPPMSFGGGCGGKGGGYGKDAGSGKGPRLGDWSCHSCGNVNFADRAFCNMRKCEAPRALGEWQCPACGNKNFSDRAVCNMRKCQAPRADVDPKVVMELISKGFGKGGKGKR